MNTVTLELNGPHDRWLATFMVEGEARYEADGDTPLEATIHLVEALGKDVTR